MERFHPNFNHGLGRSYAQFRFAHFGIKNTMHCFDPNVSFSTSILLYNFHFADIPYLVRKEQYGQLISIQLISTKRFLYIYLYIYIYIYIYNQVDHLRRNFGNLLRPLRCRRKLTKLCTAPFRIVISFLRHRSQLM